MRFRLTAPIVATAILLVIASQTQASIFNADLDGGGGTIAFAQGSSPVDTGDWSGELESGFSNPPFGPSNYSGRAAAERGLLRARMGVVAMPSLFGGFYAQLAADAYFVLDDVIITGPSGGPSAVPATMNVRVDGDFSYHLEGGGALAQLYMRLDMGTSFGDGSFEQGGYSVGSSSTPAFGLFAGQSGNSIHDTFSMTHTLSTTEANRVGVRIEAGAGASRSNFNWASASTDFFNTVHFDTDGPVFDLPSGYTANSVSGNIVDNRWVNPADNAAAPEPASLAVWLGLLTMGAVALRRNRGSH